MKATSGHIFLTLCIILLFTTDTRVAGRMTTSLSSIGVITSEQTHRHRHTKSTNPSHKALAKRPAEYHSLQFMINLYRKAADITGRPREHKLFGSNTVRLLQASTVNKCNLSSSPGSVQYSYTVEYELGNLPLDKLVRASFVHLRSPVSQQLPLICEARTSSPDHSREPDFSTSHRVLLGPLTHWSEADITPHVSKRFGGRLSFSAQYRCVVSDWMLWNGKPNGTRSKRFLADYHLSPPALLLFLEEVGHPIEWAGLEGDAAPSRPLLRPRRSLEVAGSIVSNIPNYKRAKNSVAKNQCKLHSYRVAFRDLGWDHWIIAPHKYNPRYCMGDCPRVLHYGLNAPNHAIVQTFIYELGVADVPLPSCVPYKYKPISVLMMERNGNIVYKEYEDMIAESCTCR